MSRKAFLLRLLFWGSGLSFALAMINFLRIPVYLPREAQVVLGRPEVLAAEKMTYFPLYQIWLVYADQAFFALKAVCPHMGCQPRWQQPHFVCPCHGSQFQVSGQRINGPARRALERYPVRMNAQGQVVVNLSRSYRWEQDQWQAPDASLPWQFARSTS